MLLCERQSRGLHGIYPLLCSRSAYFKQHWSERLNYNSLYHPHLFDVMPNTE